METDPDARLSLTEKCARVAAQSLAATLGLPLDPSRWSDAERSRFAWLARGEGILFLLEAPFLEHFQIPRFARDDKDQNRVRNLCLLADARAISGALNRGNVPHRFVLGVALLRLYPDAGLRLLQDIDLWIPPAEERRAVQTLADLGFAQVPHGEIVLRRERPTPANLDVHTELLPLDLATLQRSASGALGLPCLDPTDEMLSLVWRALIHHGRYRQGWLVDLALLLTLEKPRIDFDRLQYEARRWRLYPALAHTARRLSAFLPPEEIRPLGPTRRHRSRLGERAIASFWDGPGFRGAGNLAEAYWLAAPAHERWRRALRILAPDREFLSRRHGNPGGFDLHFLRWTRPARLASQAARLLIPKPARLTPLAHRR